MDKYEVFISYSRKDMVIADRIEKELTSRGISCFIDRSEIDLGEDFAEKIARCIRNCEIMLFVWSENSNQSENTANEIALAIEFEKTIVSFKIGKFEPDLKLIYRLVRFNRIDIEQYNEQAIIDLADKLANQLGKDPSKKSSIVQLQQELPSTLEFNVKGVDFKMIKVEGGTFSMGGTPEQGAVAFDNEYPVHKVTLSDYYIGETEVTQELWEAVMGSNPSENIGPKNPVEVVSWYDIVNDFIPKLNALTGKIFTLPTEAQWEFAARGGNKSKGYKYSGSNDIDEVVWYDINSNNETHPVCQKLPNELGIYDMSGNVLEWCSHCYVDYNVEAQTDPTWPAYGSDRVLRGGCYNFDNWNCRVSSRNCGFPDYGESDIGFRLVLSL